MSDAICRVAIDVGYRNELEYDRFKTCAVPKVCVDGKCI